MGNKISENKKPEDFKNIIDTIATYYILTMDFKNLSKLSEKEHCDKMLVLTSDIIGKYFTLQQISYLDQRVQNGEQVDVMEDDKVIYMSKEQLESLDVDVNKKERVCLGIAKFYIIIAHVFAAIVMTINPIYTYVDENGVKHEYNIYEKDKIPNDAITRVQRLNICKNRIDNLQSGQETIVNQANGNINVSPNICSINLMSDGNVKSLSDEPGIPELKQLYLDEQYDFTTGKFQGMTKETEQQYNSDLKQFYTVFTGNTDMPEDIKDFSDIKLKNYQADENCLNNKFKSSYSGNVKNDLFAQYANNIKLMIERANAKQDELLKIINILFIYVVDERTGNKKVKINPKLNDAKLSTVVKNTRKIIIDLYSKCENDYLEGVKLYEAIVDTIGFSTLINQEQNLNKIVENLSAPFVTPVVPEPFVPMPEPFVPMPEPVPFVPMPVPEPFVPMPVPVPFVPMPVPEPVSEPEPSPEPVSEPEPSPETDIDTEPETDIDTEPETDTDYDTDTENDSDADTENETQPIPDFVSPTTPTTPIITSNEPEPVVEPPTTPTTPIITSNEPTPEPVPVPTLEPSPEPVPVPTLEPSPEPTFEPSPEPTPFNVPVNVPAPAHNVFTFNITPAPELIAKGNENYQTSISTSNSIPQPTQETSGGRKRRTRRKKKQHKKRKTRKHQNKK